MNPTKFPIEVFDLFGIPAFDRGEVEILSGNKIGSLSVGIQENDVLYQK